ncbi:MAG: radical SAM protein, partial [Desulfitobacteriia bacterium]
MNKRILIQMAFNKEIRKNFFSIHRKFSASPNYRIINMLKCGLNAIKHDRLIKHGEHYILNSFIPPLNSPAFLNIANQVPGRGADFFKNHCQGKRLAPISAYVAVTGKCPYHCWHCSAKANLKSRELNTESLLTILAKLQDLGVGIIGLTGGEPLLRPDLEHLIASIDPEKSVALLFSSGYNLSLKRAQTLKKAGLLGIAISLDSIYKEKHDRLRGYTGAFDHALEAIRNARKAGLYTMSQTVCTRELLTSGEILELAEMMKLEGVQEMRILEPLPCGKLASSPSALLSPSEQDELKNLHIILNSNKKYPKVLKTTLFGGSLITDSGGCQGTPNKVVNRLGISANGGGHF